MEPEIIIGTTVVISIAVIFAVKVFLLKLVNFKMDESTITKFLEDSASDNTSCNTQTIAAAANLSRERVTTVCSNSKHINRNSTDNDYWYLKR